VRTVGFDSRYVVALELFFFVGDDDDDDDDDGEDGMRRGGDVCSAASGEYGDVDVPTRWRLGDGSSSCSMSAGECGCGGDGAETPSGGSIVVVVLVSRMRALMQLDQASPSAGMTVEEP